MDERNYNILLEYLKSILYDKNIKKPDLDTLDPSFRELGRYLEILQNSLEEMREYAHDLSQGNLSRDFPSRDNLFCDSLKNLHANLNHLAWQAGQVAAGDYSQRVSFLGDFSEAFNTMTSQLQDRETRLELESQKVHSRAEVIRSYNELLVEMTRKRNEWVLVVDAETKSVVYCNKNDEDGGEGNTGQCNRCRRQLHFQQEILSWTGETQGNWEFEDEHENSYRVTSFPVEWRGRYSYVHMVSDMTRERQEMDQLENKAYYDAALGIRNRRFFMEYMENVLQEKKTVTLCYLDLDGLKYVNDRYGHLEGDCYIRSFVELIQKHFRRGDVLARVGGDEFALILEGRLEQTTEKKLEDARYCFRLENRKDYPVSFSYGITLIDGEKNDSSLDQIMQGVDRSMYEYKRKFKEKRS